MLKQISLSTLLPNILYMPYEYNENLVCFLSGNSPASEFYMLMFQNTLSVPSSEAGRCEE
jgi:hypothetical protein